MSECVLVLKSLTGWDCILCIFCSLIRNINVNLSLSRYLSRTPTTGSADIPGLQQEGNSFFDGFVKTIENCYCYFILIVTQRHVLKAYCTISNKIGGRTEKGTAGTRGPGHSCREQDMTLKENLNSDRAETPTALLWSSSWVNTALVSAPGLTQLDLPSPLTGLRSPRDLTPFPRWPHS